MLVAVSGIQRERETHVPDAPDSFLVPLSFPRISYQFFVSVLLPPLGAPRKIGPPVLGGGEGQKSLSPASAALGI